MLILRSVAFVCGIWIQTLSVNISSGFLAIIAPLPFGGGVLYVASYFDVDV